MRYSKPARTLAEQVELLMSRGMQGDPKQIESYLATVNYYRLSAYWYPFRRTGSEQLKPDTRIEEVWDRYCFDRQLRLLVMDAIERIEIAARALFTHHHALEHGPFAYVAEPSSLPYLEQGARSHLMETLAHGIDRSKEMFVAHFKKRYSESAHLPIWMATELMSFGDVVRMIISSPKPIRNQIATPFGVPSGVLESWLLSVSFVRNLCAHHSRLWNRELSVAPALPKAPGWEGINGKRLYGLLAICNYCLDRIAPSHSWAKRLSQLLEEYPTIPRTFMAIPMNWKESILWENALT